MVVTNIRYDQLIIIYEVIIYHMIKQMRHYIEISKGHKTRVRDHVPRRPTTDRTAHPQRPVRLEEDLICLYPVNTAVIQVRSEASKMSLGDVIKPPTPICLKNQLFSHTYILNTVENIFIDYKCSCKNISQLSNLIDRIEI